MGYIFSLDEFKARKIPTMADYECAVKHIRDRLERLVSPAGISGAMLHGAFVHGDGGIGSDIDVLIAMNSEANVYDLRDIVREVKDSYNVPVEMVPIISERASQGLHELDFHYVEYLRRFGTSGVVGENPLNCVGEKSSWNNPTQEVQAGIEGKLHKLMKRYTTGGSLDVTHCAFLEQVIRWPLVCAWDQLRLAGQAWGTSAPPSKATICDQFEQIFPNLQPKMLRVAKINHFRYRGFMRNAASHNHAEYENLLWDIERDFDATVVFLEANADYLAKKLAKD